MTTSIKVESRSETGSNRIRRLRQGGNIPAILYGNGGDPVMLTVPELEVGKIIKSGAKQVQLSGSVNETVDVKTIQWDTFGSQVLHVDFTRAGK